MNTTRNRSLILAQFLRASTAIIRRSAVPGSPVRTTRGEMTNALATVDAVADELEAVGAGRDLPVPTAAEREAANDR